jgi:hypothetical protein
LSEANWRVVGYIAITLGILFMIGGFIMYFYPQYYSVLGYVVYTIYPYRDYAIPLFMGGITPVVVGGGSVWRAGIEKQRVEQGPVYYCRNCGRPLTFVQQYGKWYCQNCKKYE